MGALASGGQLLLLLLPAGLSAAAVVWDRLWLLLPAALLLPVLVRLLPLCRGEELLWTVLLSVPLGLPVNLPAVRFLRDVLWTDTPLWAVLLRGGLALYVLFSAETLLLSLLAYLLRTQSSETEESPCPNPTPLPPSPPERV